MSFSLNSMLATGGLTAAIVAGWQQVKSFASYVSSFVIVRAKTDSGLRTPIYYHLKKNYKILPSGAYHFVSRWLNLRGEKNTTIVPFRVSPSTLVFVKGFRFIIVSVNSMSLTLTSLRGLIDFEALISNALDEHREQTEVEFSKKDSTNSRFHVIRVVGREKGAWASDSMQKDQRPTTGSALSNGAIEEANDSYILDVSRDASFKYPIESYTQTSETDPFEGLFFEDNVLKYVDQAKQWMSMGDWYIERGIPWRRGWLMHGPGGTGKSSLARAVAQTLRIPIYHFYLATLSDQEFIREWDSMVTPCIALLEDFDNVFHRREPQTSHRSLTFDCVLNQISGVASTNGVFLMVTTNLLDMIDPAMGVECGKDGVSTRPGRIDSVIEVGFMSKANRYRLANKILRDWPEEIDALVNKVEDVTPVQFQEMCIQRAYTKLSQPQLKLVETA